MGKLAVERVIDCAHGSNIHGHSFKINVTFSGPVINEMVSGIDFHNAISDVNEILDYLDKKYLNDVNGMGRATVENIAIYIIKRLKCKYDSLYSVTVWEGLTRYAKIYASEVEWKLTAECCLDCCYEKEWAL